MRYRRCRLPTPTKLRRCHHHHHRHRIQLDAGTAVDGGTGRRRDADGGKGRGPYSRRAVVTALMYAAQQADVRTVHRILKIKPSLVYHRDRLGRTALHYCAGGGGAGGRAAQSADLLVMAAPELVENQDQDGFTPLHLAVIAGNMQLVTFLLANGADVAAKDNEEHSVVHWAAVCGETAALRAILAAGAPVSTPDVHGGYPLHYAAQMCGGDKDSNLGLQVLQTLLGHPHVDVNVTDGDKRTPLVWAASAGSARAVLALVRAGASVEAADRDGLTALHCAASRGHTDCMDTLLTLCGASTDVIDSNGCTALHYAVTLGHADVTALLLAHGADPNKQDRKGRSPAHCGCAKGQFETVKLIGSHGANLWLKNARGDFPLHDAAGSGRRELVRWLLEMRPSQVNARNNDGRCPLHMAALNDNADMCKILLDFGAHINPILRTSKNIFMTPLDCALQKGFRSTAKFLQLHGGALASRLGDQRHQTTPSALNLHIRDDVTLLGESSSESDREAGKSQRSYRKKLPQKQERRKLSASDRDSVRSAVSSSKRKPPSSRIDYTNEIIINGRTEINIHQTKEIVIDEPTATKEEEMVAKPTRPKSAKYKRARQKSSSVEKEIRDKATSPESVIPKAKDQSTSTSEETVVEPNIGKDEATQETHLQTIKEHVDQQSIVSNTSEDVEGQEKDIVVEASVHEPPKSQETSEEQIQTNESQEEKIEEPQPPAAEDTEDRKEEEPQKEEQVVEREGTTSEADEKQVQASEEAQSVERQRTSDEKEDEEDEAIAEKLLEAIEPPSLVGSDEEVPETEIQKTDDEKVKEEVSSKEKDDENLKVDEKKSKPRAKVQPRRSKEKKQTRGKLKPAEDESTHKSFRVLDDDEAAKLERKKPRSKSEEMRLKKVSRGQKPSKIPTPLRKTTLSKSDKYLDRTHLEQSGLETRVPSLPNIQRSKEDDRCDSNLSAPIVYSDNERDSATDEEERPKARKKVKRRSRTRDSKSAGSDYESSNLIDSGFEPSPRSTRICRNISDRGVNMTTVTQSIQSNVRRYHLERKIFHQLLELKRNQIRAGQHNEAVLVKRAVDAYNQSCASTVGVGKYIPHDYSFRNFEKFLYEALRKLQRNGTEHMKGLPFGQQNANPLLCTSSTNRCMHAAHAYTGVPCAAYLPKMDHHTIPKIGFDSAECKPGTGGFLPRIGSKKAVTLELSHGADKQIISLPTDRLDSSKRYYVTFTVKGKERASQPEEDGCDVKPHRHSKSD